jgi:cytochrome b subunit of formate dehydrogenase
MADATKTVSNCVESRGSLVVASGTEVNAGSSPAGAIFKRAGFVNLTGDSMTVWHYIAASYVFVAIIGGLCLHWNKRKKHYDERDTYALKLGFQMFFLIAPITAPIFAFLMVTYPISVAFKHFFGSGS